MNAGQLIDVLKSVPPNTELYSVAYLEYTLEPTYYSFKKATVKHKEDECFIVLTDDRSGS
jgi:hypothetical protein